MVPPLFFFVFFFAAAAAAVVVCDSLGVRLLELIVSGTLGSTARVEEKEDVGSASRNAAEPCVSPRESRPPPRREPGGPDK
tara:strand:+ start:1637 stop:1879 length:243 start_codon:yes stop_codon:yes gene_type:complete